MWRGRGIKRVWQNLRRRKKRTEKEDEKHEEEEEEEEAGERGRLENEENEREEEEFLLLKPSQLYYHLHLILNCEVRWGTTNDSTTSFLHFPLFSTALSDLPSSRPVHSLMLSSRLLFCLPCLLLPFSALQNDFGKT